MLHILLLAEVIQPEVQQKVRVAAVLHFHRVVLPTLVVIREAQVRVAVRVAEVVAEAVRVVPGAEEGNFLA